jgi:Icc-related predicted phosphoesterase
MKYKCIYNKKEEYTQHPSINNINQALDLKFENKNNDVVECIQQNDFDTIQNNLSTNPLKLQIVSDLHIEYKNNDIPDPLNFITPESPILVLAGDIGSLYKFNQLKGFITKVCQLFEIVIYVPGNHEYYLHSDCNYKPLSIDVLENRLKSLENDIDNLYILNKQSIVIDNICITGCTLWTNPEIDIPKFMVPIYGFDKYSYFEKHKKDLIYINKMINYSNSKNLELVVITHHCPTYKVLNDNMTKRNKKKDKYVSLYVSNLDDIIENSNINTWICGHIHQNFDFEVTGGTRIVGNQRGKPKDKICDFSKKFIVDIIPKNKNILARS